MFKSPYTYFPVSYTYCHVFADPKILPIPLVTSALPTKNASRHPHDLNHLRFRHFHHFGPKSSKSGVIEHCRISLQKQLKSSKLLPNRTAKSQNLHFGSGHIHRPASHIHRPASPPEFHIHESKRLLDIGQSHGQSPLNHPPTAHHRPFSLLHVPRIFSAYFAHADPEDPRSGARRPKNDP